VTPLEGAAELRAGTVRTAQLLRAVPDPGVRIPGLQWTIAEAAAHLVGELTDYTRYVTGERKAHGFDDPDQSPSQRSAAANVAQLAAYPERDLGTLADALAPAVEGFLTAAAGRSGDEAIPASNGLTMTLPTMIAALLGEQVIHGIDIARASGQKWPISRGDALVVVAGVMAMVPDYVDRKLAAGLHITYELRFRGGSSYRVAIDDGSARVVGPAGPVDCVISADPVAFLLVGYGRTGQLGAILTGKIVASGRKPWLGLKFGRLITGP
jgi:uncharacterized protein (TIGR03083 family)